MSFANLFLTLFTLASTFFIYIYLTKNHPQGDVYIFTAIAFFAIVMLHSLAYYYFHEPVEDDMDSESKCDSLFAIMFFFSLMEEW
jgi:high-affinity Fe2+/Pb2+ permease